MATTTCWRRENWIRNKISLLWNSVCLLLHVCVCDTTLWLHRGTIGLQSGRRACRVGWAPEGFTQANSRQEIRKSAEQRDNDMEIRDRLTPPLGDRLLTDYDFLFFLQNKPIQLSNQFKPNLTHYTRGLHTFTYHVTSEIRSAPYHLSLSNITGIKRLLRLRLTQVMGAANLQDLMQHLWLKGQLT